MFCTCSLALLKNCSVRNLFWWNCKATGYKVSWVIKVVNRPNLIFIWYITSLTSQPSWSLGVNTFFCIFVNKNHNSSLPGIIIAIAGPLGKRSEPQRSFCSWALYLNPWQVYSPTKGQWEEQSILGASQLGLVYFPPLSNKRHFLLLMAWRESVIKI